MTKAREIAELGQKLTVDASGNLEFAGDIELDDNNKVIVGTGNDAQLYHSGTNTFLENDTGDLRLVVNEADKDFRIYSDDGSGGVTEYFRADGSIGQAMLFHYGTKKLNTTSTGIDVTGTVTADGLTVDGNTTITANTGAGNFGVTLRNDDGAGHGVKIRGGNNTSGVDSLVVTKESNDSYVLKANSTGDISFYEDTGTTPKFFWDASAERLELLTNANSAGLRIQSTGVSVRAQNEWINDYATWAAGIAADTTGDFLLYTNDTTAAARFYTSNTERMRITSSGSVGIGNSSPATALDVAGTTTTDGLNLDAIAATISDTAVDIFVYDTRKDSDGGAWRKRTQHTSWYNETLNTATRGSRKEFPAVAVIVAESNQVTIYDGDDPDLPMWMVFNCTSWNTGIPVAFDGSQSLFALNGMLVVGDKAASSGGITRIRFIEDYGQLLSGSGWAYTFEKILISGRNTQTSNVYAPYPADPQSLVNYKVNDVAMTVLPNAPIDAATGLPVPTIAVATDGGVSVIKDDGTVVDITSDQGGGYSAAASITFTSTGQLRFSRETGVRKIETFNIPSSDTSSDMWLASSDEGTTFWYTAYGATSYGDLRHLGGSSTARLAQDHIATNYGLTLVDENLSAPAKGMVHYATADYATGWMNGDIKLATLSDTDTTNVTGSELVTNGTFTSNINDWQANGNASNSWNSSGYIDLDRNGETANAGRYVAYQIITGLTVGQTYTASAEVIAVNPRFNLNIGNTALTADFAEGAEVSAAGIATVTFTATSTSVALGLGCRGSQNGTATVDNVTLRLAEPDRSVNGNGLQVFGTVTKSAVATGADLVGYSGFSTSNKLIQPYNSDLNIGTGDVCISTWVKASSIGTTQILIMRGDYTTGWRNAYEIVLSSDGTPYFETYSSTGTLARTATSGSAISTGVWHNLVGIRRGSNYEMWVNGALKNSTTASVYSISSTTANLAIGITPTQNSAPADNCSLALARISATAPSPEQIKKIYEDEKVLFQDGAQATLYGSSDAVTALAYDDSTELLHVGTSAGRSVFQGLRRVDNTTTAVGAAISASNGLVADE